MTHIRDKLVQAGEINTQSEAEGDVVDVTSGDEFVYLCEVCGGRLEFDPDFDAQYCPQCDEWRDEPCGRKRCEFCGARPSATIDEGTLMARDSMITGTVTNQETGKTLDVEHMLFPNDATLNCIVLIKKVEVYHFEENDQWEIMATCKCLDCVGSVHDLECVWQPVTRQEKDEIIATLDSGKYYTAVGNFGGYMDGAIYLFDPKCEPLPKGIKNRVVEVFKVNGKEQE